MACRTDRAVRSCSPAIAGNSSCCGQITKVGRGHFSILSLYSSLSPPPLQPEVPQSPTYSEYPPLMSILMHSSVYVLTVFITILYNIEYLGGIFKRLRISTQQSSLSKRISSGVSKNSCDRIKWSQQSIFYLLSGAFKSCKDTVLICKLMRRLQYRYCIGAWLGCLILEW